MDSHKSFEKVSLQSRRYWSLLCVNHSVSWNLCSYRFIIYACKALDFLDLFYDKLLSRSWSKRSTIIWLNNLISWPTLYTSLCFVTFFKKLYMKKDLHSKLIFLLTHSLFASFQEIRFEIFLIMWYFLILSNESSEDFIVNSS